MASHATASEYERLRQKRIKEQRAMLAKLDIAGAQHDIRTLSTPRSTATPKKRRAARATVSASERRRSDRVRGQIPVEYADGLPDTWDERMISRKRVRDSTRLFTASSEEMYTDEDRMKLGSCEKGPFGLPSLPFLAIQGPARSRPSHRPSQITSTAPARWTPVTKFTTRCAAHSSFKTQSVSSEHLSAPHSSTSKRLPLDIC